MERAGRVALSSIPFEFAEMVRSLGKNHRLEFVELGSTAISACTFEVLLVFRPPTLPYGSES